MMSKTARNSKELDAAIVVLRAQRQVDFEALKTQLDHSYEELRPSRIAKRIFSDFKNEPEAKGSIVETLLSFAGGYFSKRLLIGKSNSIIKSLIGYVIQLGATKLIATKLTTNK